MRTLQFLKPIFFNSLGCSQPEPISTGFQSNNTNGSSWPQFQQIHERENASIEQNAQPPLKIVF